MQNKKDSNDSEPQAGSYPSEDRPNEQLTTTRANVFTDGVKHVMVANGGGVVALLAFLRAIWETNKELAGYTVWGIGFMTMGIVFCLLVAPIRVRHMHAAHLMHLEKGEKADTRTRLWWAYHAFLYLGIFCFLCGACTVVVGARDALAKEKTEKADPESVPALDNRPAAQ